MAKMYPSEIDSDAPSSERRVFHDLELGLSSDWQVIHSTPYFREDKKSGAREGEVDFLLINHTVGIIGLEVKGGQEIKLDRGIFYSQPSGTDVWEKIKDPAKQVQTGIHSIIRYVKKNTDNPRLKELHGLWGVVFQGHNITGNSDFGPGLPRALIIDAADLGNPTKAVRKLLKSWNHENQAFSDDDIADLLNILMPTFELFENPVSPQAVTGAIKNRILEANQKILRLTKDQSKALEIISSQPRVSVKGYAGTGKTIVGLELARRFYEEGKKVLFLCFNRPLADHYRKTVEGPHIRNFHLFCKEELEARGGRFQAPSNQSRQEFWTEEVPDILLLMAEEDLSLRWDVIIVDEGQDFKESWWIPIQEMLAAKDSKLWVFFDPNQDLYGGSRLKGLDLTEYPLKNNVRNTKQIAEAAYGCIGIARPPQAATG